MPEGSFSNYLGHTFNYNTVPNQDGTYNVSVEGVLVSTDITPGPIKNEGLSFSEYCLTNKGKLKRNLLKVAGKRLVNWFTKGVKYF